MISWTLDVTGALDLVNQLLPAFNPIISLVLAFAILGVILTLIFGLGSVIRRSLG